MALGSIWCMSALNKALRSFGADAPGCETGLAQAQIYPPTLRERLIQQKAALAARLTDVDAAIKALDANPNFESVLDVIGKVNY
jgi:hypothetical protein